MTKTYTTVHLWCLCPGATGWDVPIDSVDEVAAVAQALANAPTCARCREVWAECDSARDVRRDVEVGCAEAAG